MTTYPLTQILIYLALLFAPPEATKVTLSGRSILNPIVLTRDAKNWRIEKMVVVISDGHLLNYNDGGNSDEDVREYVPKFAGRFSEETTTLSLPRAQTLEKVVGGFIFRTNPKQPVEYAYRITYDTGVASPTAPETITINVLGEVNKPGTYQISATGSLLDALSAAGGWTKRANLGDITLLHGAAGEKPALQRIDGKKILEGTWPGPVLKNHDTVYLKESIY